MQTSNCVFVFMFKSVILCCSALNRLSEYCRIIPSTSSRGLFDNIHFAFGDQLLNRAHCFQFGHLGLFCSEFLSVKGTHCSQIGKLGLFCSEFLSVKGTHCSQIGKLGPFCSEFLSVKGTHCSQIGKLGLFCSEFLSVSGTHCS